MSEHSLPEDLSAWPQDPYELFGVRPGIDARELKRIYTRLIRQYKPEQFPAHFRRIRDAYEQVLRFVEFFGALHRAAPAEEEVPPPAEPNLELDANDSPAELPAPRPWRADTSRTDELEQLWQRAAAGEHAAYDRLVELHTTHPEQTDVVLRLYWLLTFFPGLDAPRAPCAWLIAGLRAGGLSGPLWELYRRTISDDPEEALSDRCTRLLEESKSGARTELAECRWQAALRRGRWQVIDDDLETLHDRIAADDQENWIRLVITAAQGLALLPGDGPRQLVDECMKQINRYNHLHTRLGDALDRLELQHEAAAELRKGKVSVSPQLLQLIARSLTQSPLEIRTALLTCLDRLVKDPSLSLAELDHLQKTAPSLFGQFSRLLGQLQAWSNEPAESRSREDLAQLVRDFVDEVSLKEYREIRTRIADFCQREWIAPETIADMDAETHLANQVANDWPLRCLCLAYRLYWS